MQKYLYLLLASYLLDAYINHANKAQPTRGLPMQTYRYKNLATKARSISDAVAELSRKTGYSAQEIDRNLEVLDHGTWVAMNAVFY